MSNHLANIELLTITPYTGRTLNPRTLSIHSSPTNMMIPETFITAMAKIVKLTDPSMHPCTLRILEHIIEIIKRYSVFLPPIGLGDFTPPTPLIYWLEESFGLTHQKDYYPLTLSSNQNLKIPSIFSLTRHSETRQTQNLWPEEAFDPQEWKNTKPLLALTPEYPTNTKIF